LARQKLGQHFLADSSVLRRIAVAACSVGEPVVTEIGPGKGALRQFLLERAQHLRAIELDPELAAQIESRFPQVELIHGDALLADLGDKGPIAGNLPYYVATPIISRVLRAGRQATFLIQKEVAERITAKPGTRDYGYFSVECQLFARVEYLFTVKPGAFRPPPQVDSAVIRLIPRPQLEVPDAEAFLTLVSRSFQQKRKTLRNNLAPFYPREIVDALPEAGTRAEQLSLAQFADLFRRLSHL
jgi:16S rRNA (adenine1518-N6/adenine1519-N6)-dimethyltransferase